MWNERLCVFLRKLPLMPKFDLKTGIDQQIRSAGY